MSVQLETLPDHREKLVVVGTSVRKRADILAYYLQSLLWQELPPRTRLHFCFVDDGNDDAARKALQNVGEVLRGAPSGLGDFSDTHPVTHQWSAGAMHRVGVNKNKILQRALELKADAVWLVDSDLICDRTTLASLLALEKPIACAVYWTWWNRYQTETTNLHAGPQVWLQHPYEQQGRGYEAAEFRERLASRQLTQVWGQGACTLIERKVLEAGVNFGHLADVPGGGLMEGEDRHFCINAERHHIPMFADPWPDIFHIYHLPDDVSKAGPMATRLSQEHPAQATLGSLVSLKVEALEPVPHQSGMMQLPRQHIRGRLGTLPLVPELEEAIYHMVRGQIEIVPVHFPVHYPLAYYRNRRRLMRVTLVDCKPLGYAPVVEEELFMGPQSGKFLDHTALTKQQHAGIKEIATA